MAWFKPPKQVRDIEKMAEDIGYAIADRLGLGNVANNVVNEMKKFFKWIGATDGNTGTITVNSHALISYLKDQLGVKAQQLSRIINLIDGKLSTMPAGQSENARKVLDSERERLNKLRVGAVSDLNKVEMSMNTGTSLAQWQDSLAPSQKMTNQQMVKDMADIKTTTDIDSVERSLS